MQKPTTPQDVLRNAIEYIQTLGWTRNQYQTEAGGPVCAIGSLELGAVNNGIADFDEADNILNGHPDKDFKDADKKAYHLYRKAYDAVSQVIATEKGTSPYLVSLSGFNDTEAANRRSIIARFKRAIKLLDESKVTYDSHIARYTRKP